MVHCHQHVQKDLHYLQLDHGLDQHCLLLEGQSLEMLHQVVVVLYHLEEEPLRVTFPQHQKTEPQKLPAEYGRDAEVEGKKEKYG